MKNFDALATIAAALVIAGSGIAGLIDQGMMMVLTMALICTSSAARRTCCGSPRA